MLRTGTRTFQASNLPIKIPMSLNLPRSNSNRRLQRSGSNRQNPRTSRPTSQFSGRENLRNVTGPTSQFSGRENLRNVTADQHFDINRASSLSYGHEMPGPSDCFTFNHFASPHPPSIPVDLNFNFPSHELVFLADHMLDMILDEMVYASSSPTTTHSHTQEPTEEGKDTCIELEPAGDRTSDTVEGMKETIPALKARIKKLEDSQRVMAWWAAKYTLPALKKSTVHDDIAFSITIQAKRRLCEVLVLRRRLLELDSMIKANGLPEQNYCRDHKAGNFCLMFNTQMENIIAQEVETEFNKRQKEIEFNKQQNAKLTSTTQIQQPTTPEMTNFPQAQYPINQPSEFYTQAGPSMPQNVQYNTGPVPMQGNLGLGYQDLTMEQMQAFQGPPYMPGPVPMQSNLGPSFQGPTMEQTQAFQEWYYPYPGLGN